MVISCSLVDVDCPVLRRIQSILYLEMKTRGNTCTKKLAASHSWREKHAISCPETETCNHMPNGIALGMCHVSVLPRARNERNPPRQALHLENIKATTTSPCISQKSNTSPTVIEPWEAVRIRSALLKRYIQVIRRGDIPSSSLFLVVLGTDLEIWLRL